MLTDFVRDHAFTIAWFGLMTMVWLGWAQEDPPERLRLPLGVGSGLGLVLTGLFAYPVVTGWRTDSALTGQYAWFGVLVGLEVLAAAIGCVVLWRRGASRWMAWWVALVVARALPGPGGDAARSGRRRIGCAAGRGAVRTGAPAQGRPDDVQPSSRSGDGAQPVAVRRGLRGRVRRPSRRPGPSGRRRPLPRPRQPSARRPAGVIRPSRSSCSATKRLRCIACRGRGEG